MSEPGYEYKLTLDSSQAKAVLDALELLMRLKLGQTFTFCQAVDEWKHIEDVDYSRVKEYVEMALNELQRGMKPTEFKDESWHRLYNIFQALRYARHEAEYPETTGVDAYPPFSSGGLPVPDCEWRRKE